MRTDFIGFTTREDGTVAIYDVKTEETRVYANEQAAYVDTINSLYARIRELEVMNTRYWDTICGLDADIAKAKAILSGETGQFASYVHVPIIKQALEALEGK